MGGSGTYSATPGSSSSSGASNHCIFNFLTILEDYEDVVLTVGEVLEVILTPDNEVAAVWLQTGNIVGYISCPSQAELIECLKGCNAYKATVLDILPSTVRVRVSNK
jgi:hypothetical protein